MNQSGHQAWTHEPLLTKTSSPSPNTLSINNMKAVMKKITQKVEKITLGLKVFFENNPRCPNFENWFLIHTDLRLERRLRVNSVAALSEGLSAVPTTHSHPELQLNGAQKGGLYFLISHQNIGSLLNKRRENTTTNLETLSEIN